MRTQDWHLVDESGEPFFWLADTAWNLWCRGTPDEWDAYLTHRKAQGFNVIQFVAGWWRGCMSPVHGRPFDLVDGELVFLEPAWESLDRVFEAIESHGLIAAPTMLWTLTDIDPGQVLSEQQCTEVATRMFDRWPSRRIVWLLGGDGDYTSSESEARWKRIGRKVFGQTPDRLATLHPCGVTWVGDAFGDEPWYRIATIQTGHGSSTGDLEFLVQGDYSKSWRNLRMPFLNLEPNYEDALSYGERLHLKAYHVRRAAYWSLLVAPPAGVTYGIGSVWMWARHEGEVAENHDDTWAGRPWNEDLDTPGARSMTVLKELFGQLQWTKLRPAPEMLRDQPGLGDVRRWVAASRADDGSFAMLYSPFVGEVALAAGLTFDWIAVDPSSGALVDAEFGEDFVRVVATDEGDVLLIGVQRGDGAMALLKEKLEHPKLSVGQGG